VTINATTASIAVERGIVAAQRNVDRWSDGYLWLGDVGAEGIMHSHICHELFKANAGVVCVESPMSILKDGVTEGTGVRGRRPHALRNNGRGDIHLVSKQRENERAPYGIIEVKRLQNSDGWRSDLVRLCSAMKKYGQKDHELDFACFGIYLQAKGKAAFERSVRRLEELALEEIQPKYDSLRLKLCHYGRRQDRIAEVRKTEDDVYCWGALTISIVRKSMHFTRD
jgi:hypothetical protein